MAFGHGIVLKPLPKTELADLVIMRGSGLFLNQEEKIREK